MWRWWQQQQGKGEKKKKVYCISESLEVDNVQQSFRGVLGWGKGLGSWKLVVVLQGGLQCARCLSKVVADVVREVAD